MEEINSWEEFQKITSENEFVMIYFSHDTCQVCHVLRPKIEQLMQAEYPKVKLMYCNTERTAEVAAQNRIFTVPSILIFIQGKESYRFSRNISVLELSHAIARPYLLMFD